jgi:hypothetical protein
MAREKFDPNLDFWFENKPSGNPGHTATVSSCFFSLPKQNLDFNRIH